MENLSGLGEVTMDDRGRIAIPAKFVKTFRSIDASNDNNSNSDENLEVVVGMTMGEQLGIFPKTVHDNLCEYLESGPEYEPDWEDLKSWVMGTCEPQTLDKQNRVRIPSLLAKSLGLCGQLVIKGVGDHLEVIGMKEWEQKFDDRRGRMKETVRRAQATMREAGGTNGKTAP